MMRERKRKNYNQGYKSNFFVGKASIIFVSIGLIFMFGILYISGSNTLAAKTDTLSDLQTQKDKLTAEKERLEIEATRLQSIQEIQKSAATSESKLVPVQKINYLSSSNVALK
jgi:hypothetical protein